MHIFFYLRACQFKYHDLIITQFGFPHKTIDIICNNL